MELRPGAFSQVRGNRGKQHSLSRNHGDTAEDLLVSEGWFRLRGRLKILLVSEGWFRLRGRLKIRARGREASSVRRLFHRGLTNHSTSPTTDAGTHCIERVLGAITLSGQEPEFLGANTRR